MIDRRTARVLLCLPILIGLLTLVPNDSEATGGARPDVKVALRDGQRCRPFENHLPTLFLASGLEPGERTPRKEVCVRNDGSVTGRLTLRVFQRFDTDIKCTGDESLVDPACGFGRPGELGPNLLVMVTIRPGCAGTVPSPIERRLVALETLPAVLDPALRRDRVVCVGLQVEHRPPSEEAAVAAQTDNVIWRFAFDLSN